VRNLVRRCDAQVVFWRRLRRILGGCALLAAIAFSAFSRTGYGSLSTVAAALVVARILAGIAVAPAPIDRRGELRAAVGSLAALDGFGAAGPLISTVDYLDYQGRSVVANALTRLLKDPTADTHALSDKELAALCTAVWDTDRAPFCRRNTEFVQAVLGAVSRSYDLRAIPHLAQGGTPLPGAGGSPVQVAAAETRWRLQEMAGLVSSASDAGDGREASLVAPSAPLGKSEAV
jgi:hypothetical protein